MKYPVVILSFLISCNSNHHDKNIFVKPNTVIKHDTIYINPATDTSWQEGFGLTHDPDVDSVWGKPVSYYLDDPKCVGIAFEFYYGYFRPSDNGATAELLKYAVSDNNKLRPFYRWCLNKTIQISDGALSEYTGEPALNYAEKFPKEFFEYMDQDTTGKRYVDWMGEISYSGFDTNDNKSKTPEIKRVIQTMKSNCKSCNALILRWIEKFAKDCY